MALVAWRLIGLNFSGRPDTPYWIEKDGRVCDVDAEGWEQGVRPGMTRATAQWYYPEGKVLPWHPKQFRDVHEKIQEWLREKMEKFEQPEPWTGWWEQPRLGAEQFEQYMEEFIPHWALRVEAGVAAHLLMARAVLELGPVWNLPLWSGSGFEARVVRPSQESRWWPEIPLTLITGTTEKMKRQWKMRGWKRIGQVPGLQIQLQNLSEIKSTARVETISLQYHWEREAEGGFVEVFTELAARLTEELHQRTAGFQRLDVVWSGSWGTKSYKRLWPTATGDAGSVLLRLLDFLKHLPPEPPESVQIRASELISWGREQLQWGFFPPSRSANKKVWTGVCIGMSRREAVLQYWDPWRFPKDEPYGSLEAAKKRS